MGTSTRLPGPTGGGWTSAKRSLSSWTPRPQSQPGSLVEDDRREAERTAEKFRDALRDALREDPERFGIQSSARASGDRLITVLDDLRQPDPALLRGIADHPYLAPADEFVRRFVAEVGGDGRLVVDAATRRAARRVVERLVDHDGPLADPLRPGGISGELFCALYQSFFGDLVGQFVHILIAENVKLALPVLALDPTDTVAGFVADQIVKVLPDPCAVANAREPEQPRLVDIARDLLAETVAEALGLGDSGLELAA
ncbi:hypothetical protein [Micromonospora sediminimaris]|uniref:Uncharacterized protein n=1 Tax=Micromonospora sediminimaris TaxID=547162 RepID=A0A9W5XKM5_9ACTN|nr:hypothetical protein [Micromonospora sediminimaris]GIJ34656.1 hypothetical protein Vse01_38040 [Micromonospora sediminimaris]SFB82815.1 hypothetical protein SAMN05216284_101260 [Micromonospora sediminimaris]